MGALNHIFQTVLLVVTATATRAHNFCDCPCSRASELILQPYFPTGSACVRLKNTHEWKDMYLSDYMEDGGRMPYVDLTPYTGGPIPIHKHTAYWKLYYPWKNGTGQIPYVIQNILTLDFLVPTRQHTPNHFDRVVVAKPELTAKSLWTFFTGGGSVGLKIQNFVLKEYLQMDFVLRGKVRSDGRVFTNMKTPEWSKRLGEHWDPPSANGGWELRKCQFFQ